MKDKFLLATGLSFCSIFFSAYVVCLEAWAENRAETRAENRAESRAETRAEAWNKMRAYEEKHAPNALKVIVATFKAKQYADADKYLQFARSNKEDAGYIKAAESAVALSRRQFKQADELAKQALQIDPQNSRFLAQMAQVKVNLDDEQAAISYFVKVPMAAKPNPDAYMIACAGLESMDELEKAYVVAKKLVEISPDSYQGYCRAARFARGLAKLSEAEQYARKAVELGPLYKDAHFVLADSLFGLKKWKECLAACDKLLALPTAKGTREGILVLPTKARCYEGLGDYQAAAKAWTLALGQMPDPRKCLAARAQCYKKLGNLAAESKDLAELKRLDAAY